MTASKTKKPLPVCEPVEPENSLLRRLTSCLLDAASERVGGEVAIAYSDSTGERYLVRVLPENPPRPKSRP